MSSPDTRRIRLVVNGKAAGDPALRAAVKQLREEGRQLEVRVTWEGGDAARLAGEAVSDGFDLVIAAGGDGTLNEVAGGMLAATTPSPTAMAVVPYGTANDFAGGMGIEKGDPLTALQLAVTGKSTPIDVGTVNDHFFINVASGGFGAEVTANTPAHLKKALGGAAYSLVGLLTLAKLNPYACRFQSPDGESLDAKLLLLAVGNGRQCGGGFQVAPEARLDDGLLDVFLVHDAELAELGTVLSELIATDENPFVSSKQVPSFTLECDRPLQLNLDGEPYRDTSFQFDLVRRALPFVVGPRAPLTTNGLDRRT